MVLDRWVSEMAGLKDWLRAKAKDLAVPSVKVMETGLA